MDTSFLTNLLVPIFVIIVMFGLGMTLTLDDFRRVAVYPKAAIIGLTNQIILLPLVGLLLAYLFRLSPELAVGVIIIAAAPGGPASNVLTNLLRAETALSITLTGLSSIVSFITIPLWVGLALTRFMTTSGSVSVPLVQIALQVAVVTVIPVGLGLLVRTRRPGFAERMQPVVRIGSGIFIIFAIAAFLIDQSQTLGDILAQAGLPATTLCVSTIVLGYLTASLFRLKAPARVTIAIETGLQNVPLAIAVAATILGDARFAIPVAAYGLFSILVMAVILFGAVVRIPIGTKPVEGGKHVF